MLSLHFRSQLRPGSGMCGCLCKHHYRNHILHLTRDPSFIDSEYLIYVCFLHKFKWHCSW
ncbi:hypothetical protein BHE74_00014706 [Ensete ventricosum]|nr:hypothetical protein GW17_00033267 [Ensete ventricosum]RWW77152.1 hypothetical protein BHE74_00014706 [Ensete ventricosum]RZR97521.1 hypothetical protein BHM03_00026714 [Ensete ventricosum]